MCDQVSILIFSWNHQAVRIASSYSRDKKDEWNYVRVCDCYEPDFFPKLEEHISEYSPDVVVFGSQEDAIPGSYFHSDFLPEEMAKLYYNLQKRTRLMGLGIETYKALKTFDFKLRGLRLSIYAKSHLTGAIKIEEKEMRQYVGEKGQAWANCSLPFFQSKGAVASYLKIPGIEPIAFVCAHLPFDAESLKRYYEKKDISIRKEAVEKCTEAFNYLLEELVVDAKLGTDFMRVGHTFCFGDLNYRVVGNDDPLTSTHPPISQIEDIYGGYDELHLELVNGNIAIPFQEGVEGRGPMFIPTCKMRKPRKDIIHTQHVSDLFNIGHGQREPSWCDRILYHDSPLTSHCIQCNYYNRFDEGKTMKKSDHAAVIGVYKISPTTKFPL